MSVETFDGNTEKQQDVNIQDLIESVKTLDDLYQILKSTENISGTQGSYEGPELIQIIEAVKAKEVPLEAITKTFGLRDKVYELLGDTVISSELEERKKFKDAMNSSNSFEELVEVLSKAGEYNITNDEYFNAQEAINTLALIKNKEAGADAIVAAYGLRNKVQDLLSKEIENLEIEDKTSVETEEVPIEVKEEPKPEEAKSLTPEEKQEIEKQLEEIVANSEIINSQIQRTEAQIARYLKPKGNSFLNKVKGLFGFKKEDPIKNQEVQLLIEEGNQLAEKMDELMREHLELLKRLQK